MLETMRMSPKRKAVQFGQTQLRHLRILGTMLILIFSSFLQVAIPMRAWSGLLGQHDAVPSRWSGKVTSQLPRRTANSLEQRVSFLVARASHLLPWEPSCLAQATAAQILLRQHRRSGVVVIGLKKETSAHDPSHSTWLAHAWLLGQRGALTGGAAAQGFTATTVFSWDKGLQAEDITLEAAL
jgi:hypothetical protein